MKLELKHICAYLPHDLKVIFEGDDNIHSLVGIDITDRGAHIISPYNDYGCARIEDCKPILRPLSDLTNPITHNGETFVPSEKIHEDELFQAQVEMLSIGKYDYRDLSYGITEKLIEWHFDIFGLIPAGLAIDLKTVKQ